jgi:hypothetical protein
MIADKSCIIVSFADPVAAAAMRSSFTRSIPTRSNSADNVNVVFDVDVEDAGSVIVLLLLLLLYLLL